MQAATLGVASISTSELVNGAVTTAKIADDSITTAKIVAGAVVEADIAPNAVTAGKLGTDVQLGYRNVVINGAMQIAQRGTSKASITTAGYYTADRWYNNTDNTFGTWTQSVENDAPTGSGFRKSLKMLCTTANATLDANDFLTVEQRIEGQNLQQFLKGTASAKQFTLTFWAKSNVTGTYIAELRDVSNTRSVSASYTISASGTWEKKTITFPADTTGAFANDNTGALRCAFSLVMGSTYAGGTLATTWVSTVTANRFAGQMNVSAATNNFWQITGVQLEAGSVATPFEFEDFDTTYTKCMRYFQMSYLYGTSWPGYPIGGHEFHTNNSVDPGTIGGPYFNHPMRAAPTVSLYNAVSGITPGIYRASDAGNPTGSLTRIGNTHGGGIILSVASQNGYVYHWTASAEL